MILPQLQTISLTRAGGCLEVLLNRPEKRNAMNQQMSAELHQLLDWLVPQSELRVVVFRGAGGHFCAGGDIKERHAQAEQTAESSADDALLQRNIRAGQMLAKIQNLPQTTVALVEGSAFGGGLGILCVTDIAIVAASARLGMPETTLGIAPAQIAPYVVKRVGLTRARQLALTAERFDGARAYQYGFAQYLCEVDDLQTTLDKVVGQVLQCGPQANATTKRILLGVGNHSEADSIRYSAEEFATLNRNDEGREGQSAFVEKRAPAWQVEADE